MSNTFYVHDYETMGINPKTSKASQFAGIRVDADFNILPEDKNDELNIYCKMTDDYLPSPEACLVTGVTPKTILDIMQSEFEEKGKNEIVMNEDAFAKKILSVMGAQNTCSIGYNSINFDDEVTRNILFRTLRDPYTREWQRGCSRADGLEIVRLAFLIDKNIINFPFKKNENGEIEKDKNGNPQVSFRLEELSAANNITHENAHDALSDVIALIKLMKLIKDKSDEREKNGKLNIFKYAMSRTNKKKNEEELKENILRKKIFFHTSAFYGRTNFDMTICMIPNLKYRIPNAHYAIKLLDVDIEDYKILIDYSPKEIVDMMYMKKEELEEKNLKRPPLAKITVNTFSQFGDLEHLKENNEYLKINGEKLRENKRFVIENEFEITNKLNDVIQLMIEEMDNRSLSPVDADESIYKGFLSNGDKKTNDNIHLKIASKQFDKEYIAQVKYEDERMHEVFRRFVARNYDWLMDVKAAKSWEDFKIKRIKGELPFSKTECTSMDFVERLERLVKEKKDERSIRIFKELIYYFFENYANKEKYFSEELSRLKNIAEALKNT